MAKKQRIPSLLEYLEDRFGASTGDSDEIQFHCPFCLDKLGDESSDRKFWVNIVTGKCFCFRCETGYSKLEPFFRALNGGSLKMVELAIIRGEFKPPLQGLETIVKQKLNEKTDDGVVVLNPALLKPQKLPKEYLPLSSCQESPLRRHGYNYFTKVRKLDPALIDIFKVGYCVSGRFAGRLIFPVFQGGKQVYFTTRFCGNHFAKSLNPDNLDGYHRRDSCLLNYDNVVGRLRVCVSEGPISVCAHRNPPAVGLMGKIISETQIQLLEALIPKGLRELVISLDADAGRAIDKIYKATVDRFPRVRVLILNKGDPDERRDDLRELFEQRRVPNLLDRVQGRLQVSK